MLVFVIVLVVLVALFTVTCIKIVPQAEAAVVERLGSYLTTWGNGLHVKVPFIDRVRGGITLKEQVADFPPQPVITRDNVTMSIDTVVFFKICLLYTSRGIRLGARRDAGAHGACRRAGAGHARAAAAGDCVRGAPGDGPGALAGVAPAGLGPALRGLLRGGFPDAGPRRLREGAFRPALAPTAWLFSAPASPQHLSPLDRRALADNSEGAGSRSQVLAWVPSTKKPIRKTTAVVLIVERDQPNQKKAQWMEPPSGGSASLASSWNDGE